jgi:subtilisin family serine protease
MAAAHRDRWRPVDAASAAPGSLRRVTRTFRLDEAPFAGLTGRGVRVGVIDSGVAAPHPHITGAIDGAAIGIDPIEHSIRVVEGAFSDRIGHGTAVAAAIQEKAPEAQLFAVKVFDRKLSTSVPVLAAAIRFAAERGVRLISLSLGTTNGELAHLLEDEVEAAAERGVLIASALEVNGSPCFPGSLPGVLGVRMDARCARDEIRLSAHGPSALIAASPYPRPIPGIPAERNLSGISFAVANATGFLARLLEAADATGVGAVLRGLGVETG